MSVTHLTTADFRTMPWANGLGSTVELYRREDEAGRLLIRLSVADVVADGPFSSLPGIDRVLTLIEGEGFDLDFAENAPPPARLFQPVAFSGDWQTSAINLKGPSRDFNLMTQRGAFVADVKHLDTARTSSIWRIRPFPHSMWLQEMRILPQSPQRPTAGDLLLLEAEND